MNRIYKTVWNEKTRTYVAAAETAKTRGKRSSGSSLSSLSSVIVKAVAGGALVVGSSLLTNAYAQINLGNANISGTGLIGGSGCSNDPAQVNGTNNIALGCGSKVNGEDNVVFGTKAQALGGIENIVIGKNAVAKESYSIVLGSAAKADADRGIAIGAEAYAGGIMSL